jgi:hypothetical protein
LVFFGRDFGQASGNEAITRVRKNLMLEKQKQSVSGHTCGHQCDCPTKTLVTEAAAPHVGEALSDRPEAKEAVRLSALRRWLFLFLAFFGIYASSSVCPFCGAPGCPVGVSAAAFIGGVFATLWQYGKTIWETVTRVVAKRER